MIQHQTDKGTRHSYLEVYDRLFDGMEQVTLLEIGTAFGSSMHMWKLKFPLGRIYGIDIRPLGEVKGVTIVKGDATDPDILKHFDGIMFDIIIDDGSHRIADQLKSLELFYPKVKKGGLYIIEDIQDIDRDRKYFDAEIIDNRKVKGRYDDVLAVYRK